VHPKFKTPAFATIITGLLVAIPALFMNLKEVTDLSSIGTLFAFVLVCGGILKLDDEKHYVKGQFKVPYYNSKFIVPGLLIAIVAALQYFNPEGLSNFLAIHSFDDFSQRIPMFAFILVATLIGIESFRKNLSLLPVLGLLANFYLMTELGISNWMFFFFWLAGGLIIYFLYGVKHSKLRLSNP
jgi:amino acid transporter